MDVEHKSVDASVTAVEDSQSKHGEFDVILSTSDLDRDGDELYADEWKTPLPEKITFDSDHGMSVATCVGSGKPFINDAGQLQVRGTFASTPQGQNVRALVNEGHIHSVSVAFRNLPKTSKDAKPQRELLNGAFVAVPANVKARVLSSKAMKDAANWRDDTMAAIAGLFDNGEPDKKYLQGVHDLAVKLGAGCPYSDPAATEGMRNNLAADPTHVETKSSPPEESDTSTATESDTGNAATDSDTGTATDDEDVALLGKSLATQLGALGL